MKFTVEKASFLDALSTVQNVVPSRTTVQVLSNALIKAEDGVLVISTTNLEISMRCVVAAKIDEPGVTTLPIKRLVGIVRNLVSDVVEISADASDVASITSGSSRFKVLGMPPRDFPPIPTPASQVCFTLGAGILREMLRKTAYAASQDESRRVLTGILLAFKDGKLTVVSTDSRRLALVEKEVEFPPEIENELVISQKTVAELMRLLKEDGDVKIFAQKGQIIFQYGETLLASKLIDGAYPNYRQVIPRTAENKVEVRREDLLGAIRRVTEIAADDKSVPTLITFTDGQIGITMQNPDVGEAHETINAAYVGAETTLKFNPEFVMDPLRNIDTESVIIELSGGQGPVTFKCELPFLYVLMPLRGYGNN